MHQRDLSVTDHSRLCHCQWLWNRACEISETSNKSQVLIDILRHYFSLIWKLLDIKINKSSVNKRSTFLSLQVQRFSVTGKVTVECLFKDLLSNLPMIKIFHFIFLGKLKRIIKLYRPIFSVFKFLFPWMLTHICINITHTRLTLCFWSDEIIFDMFWYFYGLINSTCCVIMQFRVIS